MLDVDTLEIPEVTFYRLPARVQEMLRVYGGGIPAAQAGVFRFRVGVARIEEVLAAVQEAISSHA